MRPNARAFLFFALLGAGAGCRTRSTPGADAEPIAAPSAEPAGASLAASSDASLPRAPARALENVAEVSVGTQATCFRMQDGDVRCSGWVFERTIPHVGADAWAFPRSVGVHDAATLDVGWGVQCAVLRDGRLSCWGWYSRYAGGRDDDRQPRIIDGITDAAQVVLGLGHICVLTKRGSVECWGTNMHGETGASPGQPSTERVRVVGLESDVVEIAAGSFHTCARMKNGSLRCFGTNDYGELGTGDRKRSLVAIPVVGIRDATQIVANRFHTCALLATRVVECWGEEVAGEFGGPVADPRSGVAAVPAGPAGPAGPANTSKVSGPRVVGALKGAAEVALGADFLCGRFADGTVLCGGSNVLGRLGRKTAARDATSFGSVADLAGAVALTAHENQSCARLGDGTVKCWGYDNYGSAGTGTKEPLDHATTVLTE